MALLRASLLLIGLCLLPLSSARADQAILIGGGYNINGSQGQIELNVSWIQDVLNKVNMPVVTFFTDGDDPAPDVHYLHTKVEGDEPSPVDQLAEQLEPVARLFDNQIANARRFKNHEIKSVIGGTEASSLSNALADLFEAAPNDPTLLVFNGHGKQSKTTPDKVTMELWDDTSMTAAELHTLMEKSNAAGRFVFTQCYSGGFHRLAYKNPEQGLELSSNMRCGFTAESAYRLAEGCSASIDSDDYRDYTTFFFAALDGYDRQGEILGVETDTNSDGQVSMREAHFYTLEYAHSTDLSRSTSEDYLSAWQPWYLKWSSGRGSLPNNEYAKLYRTLADRHSIPLSDSPAKHIREKMNMYKDTAAQLQLRRIEIRHEIRAIQDELIYAAQRKWPSLSGPYTALFQSLVVSGEMIQVAQWVSEQPGYLSLVDLQNEDQTLSDSILDAERNLTQMQKLFEFRKLARLQNQLYLYAKPEEVRDYEKLVACEDSPLIFK